MRKAGGKILKTRRLPRSRRRTTTGKRRRRRGKQRRRNKEIGNKLDLKKGDRAAQVQRRWRRRAVASERPEITLKAKRRG